MPHLHFPGLSETVLHKQEPPQLQKYMPDPSRFTRFTGSPQPHFDGSFGSRLHVQPSLHWQRSASLPSIFSTCPHFIGEPQVHFPGLVLMVLHLHESPQLQVYKTSVLSLSELAVCFAAHPVRSIVMQKKSTISFMIFIAFPPPLND